MFMTTVIKSHLLNYESLIANMTLFKMSCFFATFSLLIFLLSSAFPQSYQSLETVVFLLLTQMRGSAGALSPQQIERCGDLLRKGFKEQSFITLNHAFVRHRHVHNEKCIVPD